MAKGQETYELTDQISAWKLEDGVFVRKGHDEIVNGVKSADKRWEVDLNMPINEGSFGSIYKVKDLSLSTPENPHFVALKVERPVPLPSHTANEIIKSDFVLEANKLAKLNHLSIPKVFAYTFFYDEKGIERNVVVMDYIDTSNGTISIQNESLENRLKYLEQIADAIDYAHTQNIFHGDIKSNAILIGSVLENDSRAYLVDWSNEGYFSDGSRFNLYTNFYAHPKLISREFKKANKESDLWSWTVTVIQIIHDINDDRIDFTSNGITQFLQPEELEVLRQFFITNNNFLKQSSAKDLLNIVKRVIIDKDYSLGLYTL